MQDIEILSCGGTFDKAYGRGAGVRDLTFPEDSAAEKIMERLGLKGFPVSYDQSRAKDSLDMTEEDRETVAAWCAGVKSGRCVVVRHVGSPDHIGESIYPIYRDWLPVSNEELRDHPLFFHYLSVFPETPLDQWQTDIYIPLQ